MRPLWVQSGLYGRPHSLSLPPTSRAEKNYYVSAKGYEYLYFHPPLRSLIVTVANERDRHGELGVTLKQKDLKKLDLFCRKIGL